MIKFRYKRKPANPAENEAVDARKIRLHLKQKVIGTDAVPNEQESWDSCVRAVVVSKESGLCGTAK